MINRMVSSKSVMAKIIADLDLEEDDMRISDIKEWIGEALLKIGAVTQLDHKVVILPLCDYQAKLPCDLEKIDFVAFSFWEKGGWIPMKKSTGYYTVSDRKKKPCFCKFTEYKEEQDSEESDESWNEYTNTEEYANLIRSISSETGEQPGDTLERTLKRLYRETLVWKKRPFKGTNFSPTVQYELKPGYLFSNIPCGFIKLSYFGNYTDEDGMPMIPDNPSYFEAIYWYVAMKLIYIDYFKGKKSQALYYDAKRSWNFYRQQAYAEAMMPDQNDIRNICKTWHTIYPEIDSQDTYLSTTGDSQIIHNQNSIWR